MFITRKKLEEIKSAARLEYESQLKRESELRDMHDEIWQLRRRLDMLECKTNPVPEVLTKA